jgi:hypothetical protein
MGKDLLYSRFSPWAKSYYIASFPGGKATMGENCYSNTGIVLEYIVLHSVTVVTARYGL